MSGYYDDDTLAKIATSELVAASFVKCSFEDSDGNADTHGYWSGTGTVTVSSVKYYGGAAIADIDGLGDASGLEAEEVTVTLNKLHAQVASDFSDLVWHLRRIEVLCLLFDDAHRSAFETPVFRTVGLMEQLTNDEQTGNAATFKLRVADLLQNARRAGTGYMTDGDQKSTRSDTDTIFRYVADLDRAAQITWGKKQPSYGHQHVHGQSISGS